MRLVAVTCAVALAIGTVVVPAAAQQLIPPLAGAPGSFDFSFSNPGARSLGFGGAFVALADDATAAFANPAGLVKLERPEVSLEGRHWAYETPFLAGGRVGGEPTGVGIDTAAGTRRGTSEQEVDDLSFASFVLPRERWSLAVYRHRQVAFSSRIETDGLFGLRAQPFAPRYAEIRSATDSDITAWGAAAGVRLGDRWSVGVGLSRYEVDLHTLSRFYFVSRPTPDQLFAPVPLDDAHLGIAVTLAAEEQDWGAHAGFLWQPTEGWGVGGFYREGADFPMAVRVTSGAGLPVQPGTVGPPAGTLLDVTDIDPVEFPDVYGLGVSWRARNGATTLALEWDHVGYSEILDSFDRAFDGTGGELDDADELHLGAEYVFLDRAPVIAVRAGAWLDPDHQVRQAPDRAASSDDPNSELLGALFRRGDDEWHFAIGAGVAFDHFQVDVAADLSDRVDTVAVSTIYTF
jgi:long-chain fatty acid transport protein